MAGNEATLQLGVELNLQADFYIPGIQPQNLAHLSMSTISL